MALCLCGSLAVNAHADNAGSTSAEILRLGFGARGPALGGIMPAFARGTDAAWYNPAGLARVSGREVSASYQAMVEDIGQGDVGYAYPLYEKWGGAAFISYLNYGSQARSTLTTAGAFVTVNKSGSFDAWDMAGGLAFGTKINEQFSAGFAMKAVQSNLDNSSATAFAADFGAEWNPVTSIPASIGISIRNVGTELKFDRTAEELPLAIEVGAGVELFDRKVGLYAGVDKTIHEDAKFHGGVELMPFGRIFALRGGYDGANDIGNGFTAGMGISIDQFTVDYAYIPFGTFGGNHRAALTFRF